MTVPVGFVLAAAVGPWSTRSIMASKRKASRDSWSPERRASSKRACSRGSSAPRSLATSSVGPEKVPRVAKPSVKMRRCRSRCARRWASVSSLAPAMTRSRSLRNARIPERFAVARSRCSAAGSAAAPAVTCAACWRESSPLRSCSSVAGSSARRVAVGEGVARRVLGWCRWPRRATAPGLAAWERLRQALVSAARLARSAVAVPRSLALSAAASVSRAASRPSRRAGSSAATASRARSASMRSISNMASR